MGASQRNVSIQLTDTLSAHTWLGLSRLGLALLASVWLATSLAGCGRGASSQAQGAEPGLTLAPGATSASATPGISPTSGASPPASGTLPSAPGGSSAPDTTLVGPPPLASNPGSSNLPPAPGPGLPRGYNPTRPDGTRMEVMPGVSLVLPPHASVTTGSRLGAGSASVEVRIADGVVIGVQRYPDGQGGVLEASARAYQNLVATGVQSPRRSLERWKIGDVVATTWQIPPPANGAISAGEPGEYLGLFLLNPRQQLVYLQARNPAGTPITSSTQVFGCLFSVRTS